MMTEVHTVSIVAKNRYSAKAGGRPHLSRGANEGQETVEQGQKGPGDDICQPVRPKRKQPRRHNHGDGHFHQDG